VVGADDIRQAVVIEVDRQHMGGSLAGFNSGQVLVGAGLGGTGGAHGQQGEENQKWAKKKKFGGGSFHVALLQVFDVMDVVNTSDEFQNPVIVI
jgi:hypothetical protein